MPGRAFLFKNAKFLQKGSITDVTHGYDNFEEKRFLCRCCASSPTTAAEWAAPKKLPLICGKRTNYTLWKVVCEKIWLKINELYHDFFANLDALSITFGILPCRGCWRGRTTTAKKIELLKNAFKALLLYIMRNISSIIWAKSRDKGSTLPYT